MSMDSAAEPDGHSREGRRSMLIGMASVAAFLLAWQLAPELGLINPRFTSQPSQVARTATAVLVTPEFWMHARISLLQFGLGFLLAILFSIPLGILLGTSRLARQLLDPPLMALYIAPNIVLLPIIIVWLGIGVASKVAIVFLGAIFPIIVNTMAGMREADWQLIRLCRSFGGNRFDVFRRVLLPSSLPAILLGIRLAVGRAVLGVVVAELYASQAGVGYQITTYGQSMRVDYLLVYVLAVSVFGYSLTQLIRRIEDRFQNWRPSR